MYILSRQLPSTVYSPNPRANICNIAIHLYKVAQKELKKRIKGTPYRLQGALCSFFIIFTFIFTIFSLSSASAVVVDNSPQQWPRVCVYIYTAVVISVKFQGVESAERSEISGKIPRVYILVGAVCASTPPPPLDKVEWRIIALWGRVFIRERVI